jgi:lipopolysaccharide transport system ATP-binding protein
MSIVIKAENLGKRYSLQQRETLRQSAGRWLRRVGKAFPSRVESSRIWALRHINLAVEQGDRLAVIGHNGAGKSTLLKILSRVTAPSEGSVSLTGRVGSLLEVGTGFHPDMTGRENVFLNGAIIGMSRAEVRRKFDEIVAFAGVERYIDTPVKYYSSGMAMRLGFSVSVHLEPEVMLIDEALAIGDVMFQQKSLARLQNMADSGRTLVLVNHHMDAIKLLCNKVLVLSEGFSPGVQSDVDEAIRQYLGGNSQDNRKSEWVYHGKEPLAGVARPIRFFIGDAAGRGLSMPIRNDEDAWLYVEFDLFRSGPDFHVGYRIHNADNVLCYSSFSSDCTEAEWPKMENGRNLIRSKLPKRFLNEGDYRVELSMGLYRQIELIQPGLCSAEVQFAVRGGLSDSPLWLAKRPGVTAPVLSWERV